MRIDPKFLLSGFLVAGSFLVPGCSPGGKDAPAGAAPEKPAPAEDEAGPKVSRDADGNLEITMTDEAQGEMGILVKKPATAQVSPELKGYGRVQDPAPLAALMTELATDRAASALSSNELARSKMLSGQGNASVRALQAAEAAALKDQLGMQSATDRLALAWGKAFADQPDVPAFVQSLVSLEAALVRIDLPMGEPLQAAPTGARLLTLAGQSLEAGFLGLAPGVDPQMQGRGFLFLLNPNSARLAPGESVTGFLKLPGEPLAGVILPREAVVRTEGAGWVYLLKGGGDTFIRTRISLDHPTEAGWLVTKAVTAGDYVVVVGAQQLLSVEQKGSGGD
jgi:hypothetical protein